MSDHQSTPPSNRNGSERPIPNSYWLVPSRFAAREYPGDRYPDTAAAKLRTLLEAGIDYFVNLTEQDEELEPYAEIARMQALAAGLSITHERHPIADLGVCRAVRAR